MTGWGDAVHIHRKPQTTMHNIQSTTACFPGFKIRDALDHIAAGLSEPYLGKVGSDHVQLCPQNFGHLSEAECEGLLQDYPQMQLRLHANARVFNRHVLWDASHLSADTRPYFEALADRSRRLGASAMSIHAGYPEGCRNLQGMFDNMRRLQDEVFGDVQVAVEGLYPHPKRPQLLSTWADYEALMQQGDIAYAIDLSHLNIVAHAQGQHDDLVRDLIAAPQCIEIHVSGNDGRRDSHDLLREQPWWLPMLDQAGPNAVIFTESNHARPKARRTVTTLSISPINP